MGVEGFPLNAAAHVRNRRDATRSNHEPEGVSVTRGPVGPRAVVLGGGMAGLLAARVLADAFTEVLVFERVTLTERPRGDAPGPERSLLGLGQRLLEELLPGFTEDAAMAGVVTADVGELRWHVNGERLTPASTGLLWMAAARPVLGGLVLDRVTSLPNVRVVERVDALGVVAEQDRSRVTGVRVRSQQPGSSDELISADLVIDATGQDSLAPDWLEALGYDRPREDSLALDLASVTASLAHPGGAVLPASRRRYEQLARLPERLLVVGDAVASLNPVYGHGITVAAQHALTLREHLQHGIPHALVFQKDVAAVIDAPWAMSAGGGLSYGGLGADSGEDAEVGNAFLARLQQGATRDEVLSRALLRLVCLVDPPEALMTADIVARVLGPVPRR